MPHTYLDFAEKKHLRQGRRESMWEIFLGIENIKVKELVKWDMENYEEKPLVMVIH